MIKLENLNFALVIHNHQPVDNKDEVIEMIYNKSYLPFIDLLSDHPQIKANLHYTGSLLDWLESFHPEFISKINTLVAHGQVEILGGGYYEPILSVIPDTDSIGQITALREKISRLFGATPKGCWMAERAWEPQLTEILERSKVSYTLLDEVMLSLSGIEDSFKPYLVESRGMYATIFPILRILRKSIPYRSTRTIMNYLKGVSSKDGRLAVYADDGEKFGAWPNSYERVYGTGWLESFLSAIESNSEWLNTVHLSNFLKQNPPQNRTYLSCASYPELMEWSLPPSSNSENAKGFWRLFLTKYPESARMYSKMLRTSAAVHSLGSKVSNHMLHELWKGQCNDAYWHGVFGGLYLSMLRRITYSHLIEAQKLVEKAKYNGNKFIAISKTRFDGFEEFLIDSNDLGMVASPKFGGSLVELDYKPKSVNLFDTLARRQERYHNEIEENNSSSGRKMRSIHSNMVSKEKGLRKFLVYEIGPRYSFLDYVLKDGTSPSTEIRKQLQSNSPYEAYTSRTSKTQRSASIQFSRSFKLNGKSIEIKKQIDITNESNELRVGWKITRDDDLRAYTFSPEINLGSLGDETFAARNLNSKITKRSEAITFAYPETGVRVDLDFGSPVEVWRLPINTVSKSESGYERTLQCVSVMPRYSLESSRTLNVEVLMRITH